MKKVLITALVALNVCLLAWVLSKNLPQANAQAYRGAADYVVVTANFASNSGAVYVLDMGKRKMLAWKFDITKKRMVPFKGRDLARDFRRDKNE